MISSTLHRLRPGRRSQWQLPAVAAVAAIVLLSGCSGGTGGTAQTTPGTSAAATTSAGTPSATVAATASAGTPTAETAQKELVAGFPSNLIPLMKGAEIQASSLQRSTPISVASLTATVTAKAAEVLAYYTKVYTGQKFTALPGDSVDGTPTKTFVRASGKESVVVGVVQTGSTATVTIGANVVPASLK